MLIEGAGVVAHRSTPVPFFISFRDEKIIPHSTCSSTFYCLH